MSAVEFIKSMSDEELEIFIDEWHHYHMKVEEEMKVNPTLREMNKRVGDNDYD